MDGPLYKGKLSNLFLDFVPKEIKIISYAASFGTDVWDELKKFNAVSTREFSGIKLCKNVFSLNAPHFFYPTLLVEKSFFDTMIADHTVSERYDIVY